MSKTQFADIVIIGGGLNGLAQALAFAVHGVTCHVIDRADQAAMLAPHFDGRVSAISSSSMKLFEAIGLGPALAGKGCPIEQIWVSDGLKPGALEEERHRRPTHSAADDQGLAARCCLLGHRWFLSFDPAAVCGRRPAEVQSS